MSGEEAVIHIVHSSLFLHLFSQRHHHLRIQTVIGNRLNTDTVKCLFPPGNVIVKALASSSAPCSIPPPLPVFAESD